MLIDDAKIIADQKSGDVDLVARPFVDHTVGQWSRRICGLAAPEVGIERIGLAMGDCRANALDFGVEAKIETDSDEQASLVRVLQQLGDSFRLPGQCDWLFNQYMLAMRENAVRQVLQVAFGRRSDDNY